MNDFQRSDSPIIRIDRSVPLVYPAFVRSVPKADSENLGPVEFDARDLVQEYPDGLGIESLVLAQDVFTYLEKNKMRDRCLGLREAQAIRERGTEFFREHFAGEAVFCWKCVVWSRSGFNHIPFLFELAGNVTIEWFPLDVRRSIVNKLVYFPE